MTLSYPVRVAGQPCLRLRAADGASALVSPWGAQVLAWQPAGGPEQLFLSARSALDGSAPVRGGVPIVFPQFANLGPLPAHGLVRTRAWSVRVGGSANAEVSNPVHSVTLALQDDEATRALWPHAFGCEFTVTVGGSSLTMALKVHNPGPQPFQFQAALHTYLRVDDIAAVRLAGLGSTPFLDRSSGGDPRPAEGAPELTFASETDRIYPAAPPSLWLREPGRHVQISQEGFTDTVVWNPGAERAARLHDLEPGGHVKMLCVEAACVVPPVNLAPAGQWQGLQRLTALA